MQSGQIARDPIRWRFFVPQVRTKQRKKLVRPRISMVVPMTPNERWSLEFVSDQLACGRRFRILNVVDDYSRECSTSPGAVFTTGQGVGRVDVRNRTGQWIGVSERSLPTTGNAMERHA